MPLPLDKIRKLRLCIQPGRAGCKYCELASEMQRLKQVVDTPEITEISKQIDLQVIPPGELCYAFKMFITSSDTSLLEGLLGPKVWQAVPCLVFDEIIKYFTRREQRLRANGKIGPRPP